MPSTSRLWGQIENNLLKKITWLYVSELHADVADFYYVRVSIYIYIYIGDKDDV